jgi:hypothetical protein
MLEKAEVAPERMRRQGIGTAGARLLKDVGNVDIEKRSDVFWT